MIGFNYRNRNRRYLCYKILPIIQLNVRCINATDPKLVIGHNVLATRKPCKTQPN